MRITQARAVGSITRCKYRAHTRNPCDPTTHFSQKVPGGPASQVRCVTALGIVLSVRRAGTSVHKNGVQTATHELTGGRARGTRRTEFGAGRQGAHTHTCDPGFSHSRRASVVARHALPSSGG